MQSTSALFFVCIGLSELFFPPHRTMKLAVLTSLGAAAAVAALELPLGVPSGYLDAITNSTLLTSVLNGTYSHIIVGAGTCASPMLSSPGSCAHSSSQPVSLLPRAFPPFRLTLC